MKQYEAPGMEMLTLEAEDILTASGVIDDIVTPEDGAAASSRQDSVWNSNWS